MDDDTITTIYCNVDDLCKALEHYCTSPLLPNGKAPKWFPASRLSLSEVMDHHFTVSSLSLPPLQGILQGVCVRSYAELFHRTGQLPSIWGTDELCAASSAGVYERIEAGEVYQHQLYRLNSFESMP